MRTLGYYLNVLPAFVTFAAMLLCASPLAAQSQSPAYLGNAIKPNSYHAYKNAPDHLYDTITAGGVDYKKGFTLSITYGPTEHGYAEFNIGGKYSTLMFILGTGWNASCTGTDKGVIVVTADGRKLTFEKAGMSSMNHLAFTVAPMGLATDDPISLKSTPMQKLLIGADGEAVAEIELHDRMKPTTYTIPINRCHQLMFWLDCSDCTSAKYVFYDAVLSR